VRKVDPLKHEEKRLDILEAAARCFERHGFHGASTAQICAEAKISAGHLYHYFDSKEAIVASMTRGHLDRATSRFNEMMKSPNPVGALLGTFENERMDRSRPKRFLLLDMLAEASRNPKIAEILQEHSLRLHAMLTTFLKKAQGSGHIDQDLDADIVATILMSVMDGSNSLELRDPEIDLRKTAAMFQLLISRFLVAK
jgi:AcrR family transcriptional regulator